MTNPISSTHANGANHANHISQPPVRQPQPQPQAPKSGAIPKDTVTLKTAGDADHDGDSH